MPGGQEEGDGIDAILEEVINRCESKIDLFCSGSRTRCPRVRALVYIRYLLPLRARPAPPLPGVDIAGELGRSTYREEPSRDISIATRLRV